MRYQLSYSNPHTHLLEVECWLENVASDVTVLRLPAWRPGRYELANFAKNIIFWSVVDLEGNELRNHKTSKDCWHIETAGVDVLGIKYTYYANQLDAGSTFLDPTELFVNPINCLVYDEDRIDEQCELLIRVPEDYAIATGLQRVGDKFIADDFHQLIDSPFIASPTIQHNMFAYDGIEFHLWFQGECKPDWGKIIRDFFIVVNEQYEMFGEFPARDYHFMFQIMPHPAYHGVEHQNCTVIMLGPSYHLMKGQLYDEFLGVSSHELFHTWNIKQIRPVEMYPYNYSKENYSRLGYVAEGVTSYYGDLLLYRSGVWDDDEYFKTLNERLQRHFDNFGRFNMSVAESSFDTWLDGYVLGVPDRKVSIYTEGCLLAFVADVLIRRATSNEKALDDVMRMLYHDLAKKGKGYSEEDYKNILESIGGVSFTDYFEKYVWGTEDDQPLLEECFEYLGCELQCVNSDKAHEAMLGFKVSDVACKVTKVYPGSLAAKAGLQREDEICAVNGYAVNNDPEVLTGWTGYFGRQHMCFAIKRVGRHVEANMRSGDMCYYKTCSIRRSKEASEEQRIAFSRWAGKPFSPV